MMPRVLVEIIGFSGEDAAVIERAGGGRVELCSAFALGGLTPSAGTLREAKARASDSGDGDAPPARVGDGVLGRASSTRCGMISTR